MLIRIRTNVGTWRIDMAPHGPNATVSDLYAAIRSEKGDGGDNPVFTRPISSDPRCSEGGLDPSSRQSLAGDLGLKNGDMLYASVDADTLRQAAGGAVPTATFIDADGTIGRRTATSDDLGKSFRPGMMALRDMKMSWTLNDFMAMDERFNFKIKRQEGASACAHVSVASDEAAGFQAYLREFGFRRGRFGYLYGRYEDVDENDEDKKEAKEEEKKPAQSEEKKPAQSEDAPRKAVVECIYEPPQTYDAETDTFESLEDPSEPAVASLASFLGLERVGWIFGHAPREDGFQFTSNEVMMAAELQLEAADGVKATPFVTVKVTVDPEGNAVVDAFQVSMQCMEMVAEGALDIHPTKAGYCSVSETFTAIMEGKKSPEVENNFFLTVVPIGRHVSDKFVTMFPKANREGVPQTHDAMKRQLSKSGTRGWTFIDLLSDFALLLYIGQFLEVDSDIMKKVYRSVVDRNVPLDDGYKIILAGMVGMDGAY